MYCTNCGIQTSDTDNFCRECGHETPVGREARRQNNSGYGAPRRLYRYPSARRDTSTGVQGIEYAPGAPYRRDVSA